MFTNDPLQAAAPETSDRACEGGSNEASSGPLSLDRTVR